MCLFIHFSPSHFFKNGIHFIFFTAQTLVTKPPTTLQMNSETVKRYYLQNIIYNTKNDLPSYFTQYCTLLQSNPTYAIESQRIVPECSLLDSQWGNCTFESILIANTSERRLAWNPVTVTKVITTLWYLSPPELQMVQSRKNLSCDPTLYAGLLPNSRPQTAYCIYSLLLATSL